MKTNLVFLLVVVFFSKPLLAQDKVNRFDENGKRHGLWQKYYPNTTQLRYQGTFNHGKEIGEFKFYCETCKEQPIALKKFSENDSIAQVTFFTKKGIPISKGQMVGKKRIGKWVYFHKDGKTLLSEENYANGLLEGLKITYYPNQVITQETHYLNGKKNGIEKYYSPQGVLLKQFFYKDDTLQGNAKYYDADGNLIIEGTYKDGRKHGLWRYYKGGKLIKEERFPKPLKKVKND